MTIKGTTMNQVEIVVGNKHQLIVLPIVKEVTNNTLSGLGTDKFDRVVIDSEISGLKTDQDKDITMKGNNYLVVTFEETTTAHSQATGQAFHILTPPIFIDENLGFTIHATHSSSNIKIKLKGYSRSRNGTKAIFDAYFSRINQGHETMIHDVSYSYELPEPAIDLLNHIHELREAKDGYGDTLKDYIEYNSKSNLKFSSNASGTVSGITIVEEQTRIPSALRPSVHDKKNFEKNPETGMYEYEIECEVVVNIPMSIRIAYPLMVHNSLIDSAFVPICYTDNYNIKVPDIIFGCLVDFERPVVLGQVSNDVCIRIPKQDNFKESFPDQPALRRMAMILMQIDPEDRYTIMDLTDLGDKLIEPTVLEFMRAYHDDICHYQKSIFKINVYSNNVRVNDDVFYCTEDLVIMSKEKLSYRASYRVSINILGSFELISPKGWSNLLKYPRTLVEVIIHLNANLAGEKRLHEIYQKNKLSAFDIRWVKSLRNIITGLTAGFN